MRLFEIASAEEQIALFKLVSDSVWAALATQQRQQAEAEAARLRAAQSKPKGGVKSKLRKHYSTPKLQIPKSAQAAQQLALQPQSAYVQNTPVATQSKAGVGGGAAVGGANGKLA